MGGGGLGGLFMFNFKHNFYEHCIGVFGIPNIRQKSPLRRNVCYYNFHTRVIMVRINGGHARLFLHEILKLRVFS